MGKGGKRTVGEKNKRTVMLTARAEELADRLAEHTGLPNRSAVVEQAIRDWAKRERIDTDEKDEKGR